MANTLHILQAALQDATRQNPALAQAYREERAVLASATAVQELLEVVGFSIEEAADTPMLARTGMDVQDLENIARGVLERKVTVEDLASVGAAFGFSLQFHFVRSGDELEGQGRELDEDAVVETTLQIV